MSVGLVDTTVIIDLLRKIPAALNWRNTLTSKLSVTPITWLEVFNGSDTKAKLASAEIVLNQFETVYLTAADMKWAIEKLKKHRLNKGVRGNDCLIAAVAHRLKIPIYTHNLDDMRAVLKPHFVRQPY